MKTSNVFKAVGNFDRVAPAGQRVYPTSDTEEEDDDMVSNSALQNASNANRFHYKTPNLSDRLKSEQLHEEMAKVINSLLFAKRLAFKIFVFH